MEQTVVRSGSPFEVLALVEGTLGFRPSESLVLVSLRPPRWRSGLVARADLADLAAPDALAVLADHVAADGAGRCFTAVVTDAGSVPRPRRGGRRRPPPRGRARLEALPRARLARDVEDALRARGVEPEPWLVHRGRLYSYSCDAPCCPPAGLSMGRLRSTQVAAELVLAGRVLAPDRQEWAAALQRSLQPEASAAAAQVGDLLADLLADRREEPPDGAAVAALAAWRAAVASQGATGRPELDPSTAALLLDGLGRLPLRDLMLGAAAPDALPPCPRGPRCGHCELCRLCGRPAPAAGVRAGAAPLQQPVPLEPRAAVAVLQALARLAPPGRRAAPLGCAAYLLWSSGAAAPAGVHAERALADDPSHSLGGLVLQAVRVGLRPPGVDRTGTTAPPGGASTW